MGSARSPSGERGENLQKGGMERSEAGGLRGAASPSARPIGEAAFPEMPPRRWKFLAVRGNICSGEGSVRRCWKGVVRNQRLVQIN